MPILNYTTTIATQAAQLAWKEGLIRQLTEVDMPAMEAGNERLRAELAMMKQWQVADDGPLGTAGAELHNRTIYVRCTVIDSCKHGYVLADNERLVRRVEAKGNA